MYISHTESDYGNLSKYAIRHVLIKVILQNYKKNLPPSEQIRSSENQNGDTKYAVAKKKQGCRCNYQKNE